MIWLIALIAYGIGLAFCLALMISADILNEKWDAQTQSYKGR
jgi:hypothetical protein